WLLRRGKANRGKANRGKVNRGKVNVPELHSESPASACFYQKAVNPQAMIALMTASAVAIPIAFVPVFEAAAPFGWFIGAALGALA
ncbi:MAG TPA: hypothetical protein VD841_01165, partial [Arthrobacter sp.]|nr:hypothetical protein [Arthrobacter sp.]